MRRTLSTTTVLVALTAGVGVTGIPANAAVTDLFVNNTTACSDSGPGSRTQPFCTLSAAANAVTAGQTVRTTGTFDERLTIAKSGTPGNPITFRNASEDPERITFLYGAHAGITIDGQHDVSVVGYRVEGRTGPHLAISNAARVVVERVDVDSVSTVPVAGARLTAVTDSSLTNIRIRGNSAPAVSLDAATSGVTVTSLSVVTYQNTRKGGVEVRGANNSVLRSAVHGSSASGILVTDGATGTVLAGNFISTNAGSGIDNAEASGTAITNNTVYDNCASGIRVSGASTGVSVQNNHVQGNGTTTTPCGPVITDKVGIGVYDGAVPGTIVDYNTVTASPGNPPYAWTTPVPSLDAFRAQSGQGAHDLASTGSADNVDSANTAAPGRHALDYYGRAPEDNPYVPNTGVGPVAYGDRGAREDVTGPRAELRIRTRGDGTVVADASGTTPGWVPIVSYTFSFGDGTVITQASPIASRTYFDRSNRHIRVTVTDANGLSSEDGKDYIPGDRYVPVAPVRVLDTREAIGTSGRTAVAPGESVTLPIAGLHGVPPLDVTSVTMNVTVTEPQSSGFLTVYPDGEPVPTASNLNWTPGLTVPNLVVVRVRTGKIVFRNSSGGTVHVVADLVGFHTTAVGGVFASLGPVRVLDTRAAIGRPGRTPVAPGGTLTLPVTGANGVPATGVTAVTMNVTVTEPTTNGFLTVYPNGQARPTASNLNWTPGQTVPNLVVVPVVNGKVDFHNAGGGTVHLVADLVGYHTTEFGSTFRPVSPERLLDTRSGPGSGGLSPLPPGGWVDLGVASEVRTRGVTAVVLNVTVTEPTGAGFLTVYGDLGRPRPTASNLNWRPGQTVPNLVVVPVNPVDGKVRFHNSYGGNVHVIADVVGFYGN